VRATQVIKLIIAGTLHSLRGMSRIDIYLEMLTVYRWPVVLTQVISTVSNAIHKLHTSTDPVDKERIEEGKVIISKISAVKSGMGKNAIME
jgi:hypothetical protein